VTYDTTKYLVRVTVTNSQAGDGTVNALEAKVTIHELDEQGAETEDKLDPSGDTPAFTNEYGVGTLEVTKAVSGNLASNTEEFDITVTFTNANASGTVTVTKPDGSTEDLTFTDGTAETVVSLKNGATATFENLPAGTTYTVVEDAKYQGPKVDGGTKETDEWCYDEPDYAFTNEEKTIAEDTIDSVTVTNNKETEVDTGISLDSLPYVLIVAVVLAASVVMFVNKRRSEV
jgi:hypothetical protein